jgi:hypothetical protein
MYSDYVRTLCIMWTVNVELCTILAEMLKSLKSFVILRITKFMRTQVCDPTAPADVFHT